VGKLQTAPWMKSRLGCEGPLTGVGADINWMTRESIRSTSLLASEGVPTGLDFLPFLHGIAECPSVGGFCNAPVESLVGGRVNNRYFLKVSSHREGFKIAAW
jgi:hypothetical protein